MSLRRRLGQTWVTWQQTRSSALPGPGVKPEKARKTQTAPSRRLRHLSLRRPLRRQPQNTYQEKHFSWWEYWSGRLSGLRRESPRIILAAQREESDWPREWRFENNCTYATGGRGLCPGTRPKHHIISISAGRLGTPIRCHILHHYTPKANLPPSGWKNEVVVKEKLGSK